MTPATPHALTLYRTEVLAGAQLKRPTEQDSHIKPQNFLQWRTVQHACEAANEPKFDLRHVLLVGALKSCSHVVPPKKPHSHESSSFENEENTSQKRKHDFPSSHLAGDPTGRFQNMNERQAVSRWCRWWQLQPQSSQRQLKENPGICSILAFPRICVCLGVQCRYRWYGVISASMSTDFGSHQLV